MGVKVINRSEASYDAISMEIDGSNICLGTIDWNAILNNSHKVHFTEDYIHQRDYEKKVTDFIRKYMAITDDVDSLKNLIEYMGVCALDDIKFHEVFENEEYKKLVSKMSSYALSSKDKVELATFIATNSGNPFGEDCKNAYNRLLQMQSSEDYKMSVFLSKMDKQYNEYTKSEINKGISKKREI